MADYPNHLNPFKRTGLRESFRSLKSAIGGRFRVKKDKPERSSDQPPTSPTIGTRLRQDGRTNGAVPRSETIIGATGTPEMLPRSRFNERVTRAKTMDFRARNERNPFDDDETKIADGVDGNGTPEVAAAKVQVNGKINAGNGTGTARHHRRKKRAPLPPGARNTLGVPGEHSSSQWSIDSYTSYDTDYSSTTQAHSENEEVNAETAERLKDIQEISREIQGLCVDNDQVSHDQGTTIDEDTNKDVSSAQHEIVEEVKSPDSTTAELGHIENDRAETDASTVQHELVEEVKPPEPTTNEPGHAEEDTSLNIEIKESNTVEADVKEEEKQDVVESEVKHLNNRTEDTTEIEEDSNTDNHRPEINKSSTEEINNNVKENTQKSTSEEHSKSNGFERNTEITIVKTEDVSQKFEMEDETEEKVTDCDTPKDSIPSKEREETESNTNDQISENDIVTNSKDVSYVDRRSIFIAGSTDNLLDVHQTETTLYITGSCDQLDGSPAPTPKIRKHKLGRDALLGSTDDGLNISSDKQ